MTKTIRDFPTIEEAAHERAREVQETLRDRETEIAGFRFYGEQDNSGTWYWTREEEGDAIAATPFWQGRCVLPIEWSDMDVDTLASERKEISLDLTPDAYIEAVREFIEENVEGA